MTPSEIQRVRTDLRERGYPADDWTDDVIEGLPRWEDASRPWMSSRKYVAAGTYKLGAVMVDSKLSNFSFCVQMIEYNRPCNRLAIMHILEQEAAKQ